VINVPGTEDGITRLGASGGFMGHVLLALSAPHGVARNSAEAVSFSKAWPNEFVSKIWLVSTIESCRDHEGYHETRYIMYVDLSSRIWLHGECIQASDGTLSSIVKFEEPAAAQIFQSPAKFRDHFCAEIAQMVLKQMKLTEASWSWGTAIKAYLFSSELATPRHDPAVMEELEKQWVADPICTSVVIVFWQRYMAELAQSGAAAHLIYQNMPLKADRALPGELLGTLAAHGWTVIDKVSALSMAPAIGRMRTATI
jgi:hypothetical protein